jgi:hypothetical protein
VLWLAFNWAGNTVPVYQKLLFAHEWSGQLRRLWAFTEAILEASSSIGVSMWYCGC